MKAFYAGSFDPFTKGHLSIARRALDIFDSLIIGIGYNERKKGEYSIEERIRRIQKIFEGDERVTVLGYTDLTAQAAREHGAGVLVRGVRNGIDFTQEKELADINLMEFGLPTVMLPAEPGLSYVSSSLVRELMHFGEDVARFLP